MEAGGNNKAGKENYEDSDFQPVKKRGVSAAPATAKFTTKTLTDESDARWQPFFASFKDEPLIFNSCVSGLQYLKRDTCKWVRVAPGKRSRICQCVSHSGEDGGSCPVKFKLAQNIERGKWRAQINFAEHGSCVSEIVQHTVQYRENWNVVVELIEANRGKPAYCQKQQVDAAWDGSEESREYFPDPAACRNLARNKQRQVKAEHGPVDLVLGLTEFIDQNSPPDTREAFLERQSKQNPVTPFVMMYER
eukprot:gene5909-7111_t